MHGGPFGWHISYLYLNSEVNLLLISIQIWSEYRPTSWNMFYSFFFIFTTQWQSFQKDPQALIFWNISTFSTASMTGIGTVHPWEKKLDGGFRYFLCSSLFGEMIQFD